MDRRLFFKNLLGGTAALAIAPNMFAQITDAPYQVDPEKLFANKEGIWIFQGNKLIGWGPLETTAFNLSIDVEKTGEEGGFSTYTPGKRSGTYHIDKLYLLKYDGSILNEDLKVILKRNNPWMLLESQASFTDLVPSVNGYHCAVLEIIGAAQLELKKG